MTDWQRRVVAEKEELDGRIEKLKAFFETPTYANLYLKDRCRLAEQAGFMKAYSQVLGERIAMFLD